MECNKEEAFRAKKIAEKKFMERDFAGAKIFAVKAHNLYPGLDGLSQFLAILDVYISAEKRPNGEVDWYRVLGVETSADEDTIRKHFRKLVLNLHIDKYKSLGADGAFQILSEAWRVLSDKAKRTSYDQRQNLMDIYQKVPLTNWKPFVPTGQNGYQYFSNNKHSHSMNPTSAPPHFPRPGTFWTICTACKTQFEYLRDYLNSKLLCQNCRQPFLAAEVPPPPVNGNPPSPLWTSFMQSQNSTHATKMENSCVTAISMGPPSYSGSCSKVGSVVWVPPIAPLSAQRENSKRKHGDALTAAAIGESHRIEIHPSNKKGGSSATGSSNAGLSIVPKEVRLKKKRHVNEDWIDNNGRVTANQTAGRNRGIDVSGSEKSSLETSLWKWNVAGYHKPYATRDVSQSKSRDMLIVKAKEEICKKVGEYRSMDLAATTKTLAEKKEKEKGEQKTAVDDKKACVNKPPKLAKSKNKIHTNESSLTKSGDDHHTKGNDFLSMSVPDPDFHDFDKDRTEKSFGNNEVWAAYDDDDGMPRYYALVHNIISLRPFKLRISWLNSKTNREFSPLNWIGSGFRKTSGDFWIGKREVNISLNSFSHKVKWTKGARGIIQLYPRTGDIWAVYRNWSPDWNALTPDEVVHKYDMVEVLEDYNKERGVTVAPLVKVAGFKTVFCRHPNPSVTKTISTDEMFRLSHQVPSYWLTGREGHNAPRGCWELDPASTPLELLQVLTEIQVKEMVENLETVEKATERYPSGDEKNFKEDQSHQKGKTTKENSMVEHDTTKDAVGDKRNKGKETKEDKIIVYKRRR